MPEQLELVFSPAAAAAAQIIEDHIRQMYPAFAGKKRVPRHWMLLEALAFTRVHLPTAAALDGYLGDFIQDRKGNKRSYFEVTAGIEAESAAVYAALVANKPADWTFWSVVKNQYGDPNQRAIYYIAMRNMADSLTAGKGEDA